MISPTVSHRMPFFQNHCDYAMNVKIVTDGPLNGYSIAVKKGEENYEYKAIDIFTKYVLSFKMEL